MVFACLAFLIVSCGSSGRTANAEETTTAAGQPWSYAQRFSTEAGIQRSYELPLEGFEPVGMRLDPAPSAPRTLDPSSISQVSVYVLDKQQGPFELIISAIDATA